MIPIDVPKSKAGKVNYDSLESLGKSQKSGARQLELPQGMEPLTQNEISLIKMVRKIESGKKVQENPLKQNQTSFKDFLTKVQSKIETITSKEIKSSNTLPIGQENSRLEDIKEVSTPKSPIEDNKINSDSENTEGFSLKIRSPKEELAKALQDLKTPQEKNHLIIYKKALQDACSENNHLRSEILQSRRKTTQLQLENAEMKDTILDLADAMEITAESKMLEKLSLS